MATPTIAGAQDWLATHFSVANPVEEMIRRSGSAERTFKRRFTAATGLSPIAYVQRSGSRKPSAGWSAPSESVDDISWRVGYEEPAFFRRLFKRITGLTPATYRRRFRIPDFALPKRPG